MAALNGEVSWFCCGSAWGPCSSAGGGACGDCNSSGMQHAWPNTSDACFAITHPDSCGISGMSRRGCGYAHATTNLCTNARVVTTVADCGPQTDLFCGEQACCGGTCASNRILDLTPAAFSAIGSLSGGLLPASVDAG